MKALVRLNMLGILMVASVSLKAADITVCGDCAIQSITKAIEIANPGDHILVKGGTYKEGNIVINKTLVLEGSGRPVIDGEGETEILTVKAHSVQIKGFVIRNVGVSYVDDRAGIKVWNSRDVIIEGNELQNTFFGIYFARSTGVIRNNTIKGIPKMETNSGNAIHLWYCRKMTIENNHVSGHRDGIYFEFVDESDITGNVSTRNIRYGLHFMFSNDNTYTRNTFENNGAGVAVMYSENIDMIDNRFANNWGEIAHGLLLKDIRDSEIRGNEFVSNTIGMYAEGSNRIEVTNNEFVQNGWALKILGNCEDNHFTYNNFIANTFEVTTNSKSNYNKFEKNYWSGYSGYDLDKDGIGDVPYRPVKLFTYMIEKIPSSIILLRSLFVDLLNLAEKVTPVLTPETLIDEKPLMKEI